MEMDRRRVLDLLASGVILTAAPSTLSASNAPLANAGSRSAALLLPVSGASAELGLSMQRATRLAQSGRDEKTAFPLFDTGDTPEGAGRAATSAIAGGASAILGPVFAVQVPSVAAAVASTVPVISFSNSAVPPGSGIITFGITPSQSVSAILQYARARGVRRIALVGTGSPWSEQAERAARRLAPEIGLQLADFEASAGTSEAELLQLLRGAAGGLPDAALLTGGPAQFGAQAQLLQANGVQVLGTLQGMDGSAAGKVTLDGAWLSAPDPAAVAAFAGRLPSVGGKPPGMIAALAFDAANIVEELRRTGKMTREGLIGASGFSGVTGAVRFRPDGRCVRELAIVTMSSGSFRTVGRKAGL